MKVIFFSPKSIYKVTKIGLKSDEKVKMKVCFTLYYGISRSNNVLYFILTYPHKVCVCSTRERKESKRVREGEREGER